MQKLQTKAEEAMNFREMRTLGMTPVYILLLQDEIRPAKRAAASSRSIAG